MSATRLGKIVPRKVVIIILCYELGVPILGINGLTCTCLVIEQVSAPYGQVLSTSTIDRQIVEVNNSGHH